MGEKRLKERDLSIKTAFRTLTLSETYKMAVARLSPLYGVSEASAIVGRLLVDKYGIGPLERVVNPFAPFFGSQTFQQDLRRLEKWEPVQYVVGSEEFYGRSFEVTRDTLIPRVETEQLVREILSRLATVGGGSRILDIGTGSGAIAVTLACECPEAQVEAWDISAPALAVARRNAVRHQAKIEFRERDILNPEFVRPEYDLVVSNPPYVLDSERLAMRQNVTDYEPEGALYVSDDDPLRFYRAIARLPLLRPGGALWFEINERYGLAIAALLSENGYTGVTIMQDIHGRDRMACGIHQ